MVLCLNFWRTSIVFHRVTLSKQDQPRLKTFQHLQIRSKPLPSLKRPCMIWPPLLPPPLLLTLLWPHWPLCCSWNNKMGFLLRPRHLLFCLLGRFFSKILPRLLLPCHLGLSLKVPSSKQPPPDYSVLGRHSNITFLLKNPSRSSPTSTQPFLPQSFHRTLCIFHHSHYYPPPHHHC